jgi:hypothetical protein
MNIDPMLPRSAPIAEEFGASVAIMLKPQPLAELPTHTWVRLYIPEKSHTPTHFNRKTDKHYTVIGGIVTVFRFDESYVFSPKEYTNGESFVIEAGKPHFLAVLNYGCYLTMWREGTEPNAWWEAEAEGVPVQSAWRIEC